MNIISAGDGVTAFCSANAFDFFKQKALRNGAVVLQGFAEVRCTQLLFLLVVSVRGQSPGGII